MNARLAFTAVPLAGLCLVGATAVAGPAGLVKVGDTGTVSVYVDRDSIQRSGSQARAALEWRWSRAAEIADRPGRTYRLERQVQISNCDTRSYAIAEGTQYADERGIEPVGSYRHDESALPFTIAPARTIRDAVVTYVCQASVAKKS